jgi:TRAP-type C4-dicarboxylate transport system permease small subunit
MKKIDSKCITAGILLLVGGFVFGSYKTVTTMIQSFNDLSSRSSETALNSGMAEGISKSFSNIMLAIPVIFLGLVLIVVGILVRNKTREKATISD